MPDTFDTLKAALADRYRIERELGQGGTATVYLALDLKHDRRVALKVLRPDLVAALGQERFLREIGVAAALTHPNIVALLDSGVAAGTLYYTMPYFEGGSLRVRLDRERELPIDEATRIVLDVLQALHHAHAAGITHRDIKPENILFAGSRAFVADFGIAKVATLASTAKLTETGIALGTPAYMAPEQAAADPQVDHRADLYALGAVWYEMLVGAPLFSGRSPQQLIAAHISQPPEPPNQVRSAIPMALSDIVLRCLEKRPADRWQSAEALAKLLVNAEDTGAASLTSRVQQVPSIRVFALSELLCQRLSPDAFDPRMVGDAMVYLDNGRVSDTLICYLTRWCIDSEDGSDFLRHTPYRAVAPALFGFDAGRRYRTSLPIADHLILLGGLLRELVISTGARHVVLIGFSTGGDLALRLAAADPALHQAPIDAALLLGPNLAIENAFASAQLARVETDDEAALLPFLRQVTDGVGSLQEWLDVNEYLVRLMRRFRSDMPVLRDFARGISDPFADPLRMPFAGWYRESARLGRQLRGVFEDSPSYRRLVRELQVGQRDTALLGEHYQQGSLVIEAATNHFDLEAPTLISRHLDPLVLFLRSRMS